MPAAPAPRSRRFRGASALIALFALVATLAVSASPAAAATCDDTTNDLAIGLTANAGSTTTLRMGTNGVVSLDGVACGGVATSVTIFDFSPATGAKTVVLDATNSWGGVFVTLFLSFDPDNRPTYDVVVITGDEAETVTVSSTLIQVLNTETDAPHLLIGNFDDSLDLDFRLGDGDDSFNIIENGGTSVVGLSVLGGPGDDTIAGSDMNDRLRGGKGDDDIRGRGGDDTIRGQSGEDTLRGGGGDDDVRGGTARDSVFGNSGNDTLYGNSNDDRIRGGGGNDFIHGGRGEDDIKGNSGNDTFDVDDGFVDRVSGGPGGNDTCDRCDPEDRVTASVENP